MENNTIEKMEVKRFYALLLRTILVTLLSVVFIMQVFYFDDHDAYKKLFPYYLPVMLVYMVVQWRTATLLEKIKKDKKLAGALDGEIYKIYNYKALATGFYAILIASFILFMTSLRLNLSGPVCCMTIVAVALISSEVRRLILYKPW